MFAIPAEKGLPLRKIYSAFAASIALPLTGFHLHTDNTLEKVFWGRTKVCHAMAAYYYNQGAMVRRLVHQFKYHRRRDIALHLGRQMGLMLQQSAWLNEIDCIVPVPLHRAKVRRRGYKPVSPCWLQAWLRSSACPYCRMPCSGSAIQIRKPVRDARIPLGKCVGGLCCKGSRRRSGQARTADRRCDHHRRHYRGLLPGPPGGRGHCQRLRTGIYSLINYQLF